MVNRGWVLFTDRDHTFEEAEMRSFEALGAPLLKVGGPDEFLAASPKALAVLNSGFPLTGELINTLEMCRVISRFGSGYDNIDIDAAARKGIPVCNVPVFCVSEVANRTLALLLACSSHLLLLDRAARSGVWGVHNLPYAREVEGETLGLVGFGKIARAVAKRARAFGLRIVAHDPYVSPEAMSAEGVQSMDLDELLANVDYVSIHAPLNGKTRHLLDARRLTLLKASAILINTSRGAVIDESALADALRNKRIAGAGLDVFEDEPPSAENPIFALDNVVVTPHCAAHTRDATQRVRRGAIDNVLRALRGEPLQNVVNAQALSQSVRSCV